VPVELMAMDMTSNYLTLLEREIRRTAA